MKDLINALMESIKAQVQDPRTIEDISEKLMQKEYRRVFLIFNNFKECGKWILTESDEKNLEAFWWEYAN
ncbi:MAG TPA: hypothetical protein VF896_15870 [Anaerolineales bacterium]